MNHQKLAKNLPTKSIHELDYLWINNDAEIFIEINGKMIEGGKYVSGTLRKIYMRDISYNLSIFNF